MREVSDKDLKKLQLEVLSEFHNFCISHGLKYSLCAGTLLGAIRHKGYIPWDDDIDVMMPRAEYEKLKKIYNSDKYTLYTFQTHKDYMLTYSKLSDNRTLVIQESRYNSNFGANIDIFPLDYFPKSFELAKKWDRHLYFWKSIRTLKEVNCDKSRSFSKNFVLFLSHIILSVIPMKYVVKKVDDIARTYLEDNDGCVGNMTRGYRLKERTPIATGLIDVDFEGMSFKSINNYQTYLSNLFGNYMQLPPKEKQVSHHGFKAYWKDAK